MYGPDTADLVDSYVAEDDVMADARSAAKSLASGEGAGENCSGTEHRNAIKTHEFRP